MTGICVDFLHGKRCAKRPCCVVKGTKCRARRRGAFIGLPNLLLSDAKARKQLQGQGANVGFWSLGEAGDSMSIALAVVMSRESHFPAARATA